MESRFDLLSLRMLCALGHIYLLSCQQTLNSGYGSGLDLLNLTLELDRQSLPLSYRGSNTGLPKDRPLVNIGVMLLAPISLDSLAPISDLLWGLEEAQCSLYVKSYCYEMVGTEFLQLHIVLLYTRIPKILPVEANVLASMDPLTLEV